MQVGRQRRTQDICVHRCPSVVSLPWGSGLPANPMSAKATASPAADSSGRGFQFVLTASTALGFGGMLGSLPLVNRGPAGIEWHFHWAAVPLFALGAVAGILYWRLVYRLQSDSDPTHARQKLKRASLAVIPIGIFGFLYPLRFIEPARRTEVFIGLAIASTVLTLVGFVLVGLIKWLNENEPPDGSTGEQ